jgi:hypothetical protein
MKAKPVEEGTITPEEQIEQDHEDVEEALIDPMDGGPIHIEPLVLMVRRQYKESGDLVTDPEEETEVIAVQSFHTDPAHASLRMNHTLNLGDYWSLSVQVGFDAPCYREEHAEAMEFVVKTVTERLVLEIEKGKERASELRGRRRQQSSSSGGSHPF